MAGVQEWVEQWCVEVPKSEGETGRRNLLRRGVLDSSLRPRVDGEVLLLPVTCPCGEGGRRRFERLHERPTLPRHEMVGGIAIMQEDDPEGARKILASRPVFHTVLLPLTAVEGACRTRRFKVLAGEPTTATGYTEYGLRFEIDLECAYFSPRLSGERRRLLSLMDEGERVLDMFAGVGPFAVTLAEKASYVVASDINPGAVRLMICNLSLNRCCNVLPVLADATHLDGVGFRPFDRIIMNLPLSSREFLDCAVRLAREGGWIHFYALQEREGEFEPLILRSGCRVVSERVVRSYSPRMWHAVYDVVVQHAEGEEGVS